MNWQVLLKGNAIKGVARAAKALPKGLKKGLSNAAVRVMGAAKRLVYEGHPDHLEGDSGRLRDSIQTDVGHLTAHVGTNVIYAPVHEFGATITPTSAQVLHWTDDGGEHFAQSVTIPPRPYMQPALEQSRKQVGEDIQNAIVDVIKP